MAPTLGELAQRFRPGLPELDLAGDPATPIHGTCSLSPGEPGCITFLNNPKLRSQLAGTRASAVILGRRDAAGFAGNALVVKDPYLAFARIAAVFDRSDDFAPGVHPTASVAEGVSIAPTTHVGAGTVIGPGARIGANAYLGPNCVIDREASLGDGCRLQGNVFVGHRVRIGKRARISAGVVIGGRGFGLARGPAGWEEVPQTGTVVLGDDVEIGANTTIDRGALGDTVLEDGVKLDNLIQVAHNVRIGAHTVMASMSGIAGSARVGARCMIGGCSCINGHIEIADDVVILGFSMVVKGIPAKGIYGGMPTQEARGWRRELARVARLETTEARIAELERRAGIEHKAHGETDGGDQDV
ncbi:MAG TPA: UDP-3-O-(3-hydroxymyristoyl)glucosamine N-acyltransferase [Verrucomicrobiae bacterium]|nr:UDP-3-O-(3-hydroxymyristoyl)glucosamine N-acyltransferase [Verrucomicrobiae bacterium]